MKQNVATEPATDEREAIRAAAVWYARMCSGITNDAEQRAWQQWLAASDLHRQAWQRVENLRQKITDIPATVAAPALNGAASGRRKALRTLTIVLIGTPMLTWTGYRFLPWPAWQADYRTAKGERRHITLADGSMLVMDASTAIDMLYDDRQRLIRLHSGRLMLTSAPDAANRPLLVATAHGQIQALGTRFTVQVENDYTLAAVLNDSVRIRPVQTATSRDLSAGQQIRFNATSIEPPQPASPSTGTWAGGNLLAIDMPLTQLLEELARYRTGFLTCDDSIGMLKISGSFPLDDTNHALALLAETFPVQLHYRTRYWVHLQAQQK